MKWSENEENFLMNNYEAMTNAEMASKLNKTVRSIEHKVVRLKLRKRIRNVEFADIDGEIWKEFIPNYEISTHGRCKRMMPELLMKTRIDRYGYLKVKLMVGGKQRDFTIHRLVANSFVTKINGKPYVNHIDGNKANPHFLNLEWITASENILHAHASGLCNPSHGEDHVHSKISNEDVHRICKFIEDGWSNKKITDHLSHLDMNKHYVSGIRMRQTRKDISKEYNFERSTTIPRGSTL